MSRSIPHSIALAGSLKTGKQAREDCIATKKIVSLEMGFQQKNIGSPANRINLHHIRNTVDEGAMAGHSTRSWGLLPNILPIQGWSRLRHGVELQEPRGLEGWQVPSWITLHDLGDGPSMETSHGEQASICKAYSEH
jgi:hypothetical protein